MFFPLERVRITALGSLCSAQWAGPLGDLRIVAAGAEQSRACHVPKFPNPGTGLRVLKARTVMATNSENENSSSGNKSSTKKSGTKNGRSTTGNASSKGSSTALPVPSWATMVASLVGVGVALGFGLFATRSRWMPYAEDVNERLHDRWEHRGDHDRHYGIEHDADDFDADDDSDWSDHGVTTAVICPLLSGPKYLLFWIEKEIGNAVQEAQAGRDHWQAA